MYLEYEPFRHSIFYIESTAIGSICTTLRIYNLLVGLALTLKRINPIDQRMNLKKQLRYYLDRTEMSATLLAKKSSIPKQSLAGWLAGSNPRDVRQVKRVADVLGVSLDHLLFGDGEEKKPESNEFESLLDGNWVGGLFEVRIRKVKK